MRDTVADPNNHLGVATEKVNEASNLVMALLRLYEKVKAENRPLDVELIEQIDNLLAPDWQDSIPKLPHLQIAKCESRMRATHRKDVGWGDWKKCSQDGYNRITALPRHAEGHYIDKGWEYDLRVLWVDVNNPRGYA
jgi:hypothetical protein